MGPEMLHDGIRDLSFVVFWMSVGQVDQENVIVAVTSFGRKRPKLVSLCIPMIWPIIQYIQRRRR